MFVKSLTDEGSEGISQASLVRDHDKLIERIAFIHEKTSSPALVEEFIEGREIYVGVFGNELLTALPPWELTMSKLRQGCPGHRHRQGQVGPELPKEGRSQVGPRQARRARWRKEIERTSKRIYRLLGLSGYARLDYRLTEQRRLYLLEANPNPQIARNEDFADSAEHAGMEYEELLQKLITLGLSYEPRP